MALSSWTVLNSVSVQTQMEGEAPLIVAGGKAVERRPREASFEILLGLFQTEFHSVEMLKDSLITFKLE